MDLNEATDLGLAIPPGLRKRAEAQGDVGRQWLAELPSLASSLEAEWDIILGDVLGGGWSIVIAATTASGEPAVLKVALPQAFDEQTSFTLELEAMRGNTRAYARVLRADIARRSALLERLGPSLGHLGLSVEDQLDAIGATLRSAWRGPSPDDHFRTGDWQAGNLARSIKNTVDELGSPIPRRVVDLAIRCAHECAARTSTVVATGRAVVIHGDAWPANLLQTRAGDYKLIDPDPMISEPAHDLGIPLRDLTDELVARGADLATTLRTWSAQMAVAGGEDAEAIWQWAFVERVSTGLFLMKLSDPHGRRMLDAAAMLNG